MAKIITCDYTTVTIRMDDNSIKEVRVENCDFVPEIGMVVKVFESNKQIFVGEVTKKPTIQRDYKLSVILFQTLIINAFSQLTENEYKPISVILFSSNVIYIGVVV